MRTRRAFTLIELLTIVVILAVMVSIGVGTLGGGKDAARVKSAARDIYASVRHARSLALVTGQRIKVNYSNVTEDDEPMAKVEIVSAKLMNTSRDDSEVQPYWVEDYADLPKKKGKEGEKIKLVNIRKAESDKEKEDVVGDGGETIEDVMFQSVSADVVKGMCIKVVKGETQLIDETAVQRSNRISVFSNVGWEDGKDKSSIAEKQPTGALAALKKSAAEKEESAEEIDKTPVSVVWQTNGTVDPHEIWIYPHGKKPEEGLLLRVDPFGGIKVLSGDGDEKDR